MGKPLVSFVITGYNEEKYICDTIKSAVEQDYDNMEIILSDNCSSDNTYKLMQECVEKYKYKRKFVLLKTAVNRHISGNLQNAIDHCSGEIIIRGCGDDINLKNRVSVTVREFDKDEYIVAAGTLCDHIDQNGVIQIVTNADVENRDYWNKKTANEQMHAVNSSRIGGFNGFGAAYRKTMLDKFPKMIDGILWDDLILTARAMLVGKGVWINEKLVLYRQHDNKNSGITGSVNEIEDKLTQKYKDLVKINEITIHDIDHLEKTGVAMTADKKTIMGYVERKMKYNIIMAEWWKLSFTQKLKSVFEYKREYRFHNEYMISRLFPKPLVWANKKIVRVGYKIGLIR